MLPVVNETIEVIPRTMDGVLGGEASNHCGSDDVYVRKYVRCSFV